MRDISAPAKINLALVVGPATENGKHEVVTVMQHVALADRIAVSNAEHLTITGFESDTIVAQALEALAAAAGIPPRWSVDIAKSIPVAAGLGGGSSDAAAALQLANQLLPEPFASDRLERIAATIGADVPFFLHRGPQLATRDGTVLRALALPQDFSVVLVMPFGITKTSTADVYRAFDARDGSAGFETRRSALLAAVDSTRIAADLASLPPNDLASSPLSQQLCDLGAFRADVSGAGPCVYALFADTALADAAASALRREGRTWVTTPSDGT